MSNLEKLIRYRYSAYVCFDNGEIPDRTLLDLIIDRLPDNGDSSIYEDKTEQDVLRMIIDKQKTCFSITFNEEEWTHILNQYTAFDKCKKVQTVACELIDPSDMCPDIGRILEKICFSPDPTYLVKWKALIDLEINDKDDTLENRILCFHDLVSEIRKQQTLMYAPIRKKVDDVIDRVREDIATELGMMRGERDQQGDIHNMLVLLGSVPDGVIHMVDGTSINSIHHNTSGSLFDRVGWTTLLVIIFVFFLVYLLLRPRYRRKKEMN